MITLLTKRFTFSSAHRMFNASFTDDRNIKEFGHCTNIHGHNYILEVTVQGDVNKETGCILNLHKLKSLVDKEVVDILDHKYLNDILPGGKVACTPNFEHQSCI